LTTPDPYEWTSKWTDPDGVGPATSFGYDSYATIQDAVNHVNTGATVNIAAGTYPEHVVIARDITLQASGVVTLLSERRAPHKRESAGG